jgi:hypothetical protein
MVCLVVLHIEHRHRNLKRVLINLGHNRLKWMRDLKSRENAKVELEVIGFFLADTLEDGGATGLEGFGGLGVVQC